MATSRARVLAAVVAAALLAGGCDRSTPMRPHACEDACPSGAAACNAAGALLRCREPATADGCRAWSTPEACGPRHACRAGACTCLSPCQPGETVCAADAEEQRCAGPDGDGCYSWAAPTACADGVACRGGSCGCAAPCQPGATACGPNGELLTCVGPDTSGCPSWAASGCGPRRACQAGTCACEDPCAAGQVQCEGLVAAVVACAAPDENGCTAWDTPAYCAVGETCQDEVGPGRVPACVTYTPPRCADVNECDFVGQKQCQSDTKYRECFIRPEDGCLRLDCFS